MVRFGGTAGRLVLSFISAHHRCIFERVGLHNGYFGKGISTYSPDYRSKFRLYGGHSFGVLFRLCFGAGLSVRKQLASRDPVMDYFNTVVSTLDHRSSRDYDSTMGDQGGGFGSEQEI